MLSTLFLSAALAGVALAAPAPVPQDFDFSAVEALPSATLLGPPTTAFVASQLITLSTAAMVASVTADITSAPIPTATDLPGKKVKRQATICTSYATGAGPVPSPDTASAFLAYADFAAAASSVAASPPASYTPMFTNLQASTQQTGYMGVYTLDSYDASACAAKCNAVALCESFNIFFERDPTVDANDASCANPPSTTNIRCTLYGYPISKNSATNTGQWRGPQDSNGEAFHVVIAGSTGFTKKFVAVTLDGFNAPVDLGNAAISAPSFMGVETYMGAHIYDTGAYDPLICASACLAQTQWDHDHPPNGGASYMPCNFFNSYVLLDNGVPVGTYCSNYAFPWDKSYATNVGQYRGSDHYTIGASYSYELTVKDSGTLS